MHSWMGTDHILFGADGGGNALLFREREGFAVFVGRGDARRKNRWSPARFRPAHARSDSVHTSVVHCDVRHFNARIVYAQRHISRKKAQRRAPRLKNDSAAACLLTGSGISGRISFG